MYPFQEVHKGIREGVSSSFQPTREGRGGGGRALRRRVNTIVPHYVHTTGESNSCIIGENMVNIWRGVWQVHTCAHTHAHDMSRIHCAYTLCSFAYTRASAHARTRSSTSTRAHARTLTCSWHMRAHEDREEEHVLRSTALEAVTQVRAHTHTRTRTRTC